MKIGSLTHQEIQWHEVENKAIHLLAYQTKDVRLLGYLIICLQHQSTPERFLLSLHLLTDFISTHWEIAHPSA